MPIRGPNSVLWLIVAELGCPSHICGKLIHFIKSTIDYLTTEIGVA